MSKFQKWCVLVAMISAVLPTALNAVQADDLEQRLASVYQNKKFTLSKPYCGVVLQFDAEGKLVQGGTDGAWTVCQDVLVKEIHRAGDVINIAGQRIYLRYDTGAQKFREVNEEIDQHAKKYKDLVDGQQVAIQIFLPVAQDAAAVQVVIDRILRPTDLFLPQSDAELWQDFRALPQNEVKESPSALLKRREIQEIGNGVSPPVVIHNPDPEYSTEARQAKYQGDGIYTIIVDHEGNVASVKVVRPLGLGLDENAAQAVRTWKFKPAQKNGTPVAVVMKVEISFNLW